MTLLTAELAPQGVTYPSSDGKPMAETDVHLRWMTRLIELLQRKFAGTQTYVSGNLLLYYVEGDPKKRVAPDVFVVKGIEPHDRRVDGQLGLHRDRLIRMLVHPVILRPVGPGDRELVKVTVEPAHNGLDHAMQGLEVQRGGHRDPPPDQRLDVF